MPTSAPLVQQRSGRATQFIFMPETAWDTDPSPVNAYIMPVIDKTGFDTNQAIEAAPVNTGDWLPPYTVDMLINGQGTIPIGLEYVFIGRLFKQAFGANGYTQPEGATGKLHEFKLPSTLGSIPASFQYMRKWLETTAIILRNSGVYTNTFHFPRENAGRAMYELGMIGSGKEYTTAPAGMPGSPTFDGYVPVSYVNYQMIMNNYIVLGLNNFDDTLNFNMSRSEASTGGYAAGIVAGFPQANGTIGTILTITGSGIESDLNFYNLALNKTEFAIDCVYADSLTAATQFFRRRYWARLERKSPESGGQAGLNQSGNWQMTRSANAIWAAERLADNLGPFNMTASNNVLGVKDTGAAAVSCTMAVNAAKTVDMMVTEINASGLNAFLVADNYLGHLRLTHKTKGSAKTLAVDTAVANSCHTLIGLSNVVYAGLGTAAVPVPMVYNLYNQLGASY